ncbi:unnamed protein product [Paramecium sonneborni]|uniref:non-specific serine/threonine protein kinase n=1 Tax=Paramecium sonneborni TaxID=65129 RepID=A0A8S1P125_9CILI|nr:unnamed protein product [Paramecium sonneborni]
MNLQINSIVEAPTKEYPKRSFQVSSLLGSGSEGKAYLAIANNWGNNPQKVALKLQATIKQNEKDFLSQLIEYQNTYENGNNQQLLPTFIIRIYDQFQWQQKYCVIMEVGSQNLFDYLNNTQNIPIQQKEKICFQITQPILFLHQQKLIHRDIKPENYIKVGDNFKLIDFGLIRNSTPYELKTMSVGTLIFQAPELIENSNQYNEKVDIWALGCVFYELLSNEALFDGTNYKEVISKIKKHKLDRNYVQTKIYALNTSQEFKLLLTQMMSYQDVSRPTIEQVYNQLNRIISKNTNIPSVSSNCITLQKNFNAQKTINPQLNQQVESFQIQQSNQQDQISENQKLNPRIDKENTSQIKIQPKNEKLEVFQSQQTQSILKTQDALQKDNSSIQKEIFSESQLNQIKLLFEEKEKFISEQIKSVEVKLINEEYIQKIIQKHSDKQKEIYQKQMDLFQNDVIQIKNQLKEKDKSIESLKLIQQQQNKFELELLKRLEVKEKQIEQILQQQDQISKLENNIKNQFQQEAHLIQQIKQSKSNEKTLKVQTLDQKVQSIDLQMKQLQEQQQNLINLQNDKLEKKIEIIQQYFSDQFYQVESNQNQRLQLQEKQFKSLIEQIREENFRTINPQFIQNTNQSNQKFQNNNDTNIQLNQDQNNKVENLDNDYLKIKKELEELREATQKKEIKIKELELSLQNANQPITQVKALIVYFQNQQNFNKFQDDYTEQFQELVRNIMQN